MPARHRAEAVPREIPNAVPGIVSPAQQREHVLDVRGFEELQAAEFDEGDVAAGQLDFERGAMAGGAEQHRLRLEALPGFAIGEDVLDDVARLRIVVGHVHQEGKIRRRAIRPEVLREALGGEFDDGVGGGEDRLRRAVVLFERDDVGLRGEVGGKSRMLRTVAARNE